MEGKHTDETKQAYCENLTKFVTHLNKRLEKSGSHFICGDKVTTADFAVCTIIFSFVENQDLGGGSDYSDKGKALIKENQPFCAYVERMKTELAHYLEARGKAPF